MKQSIERRAGPVYTIPVSLLERYRACNVVLRSPFPGELVSGARSPGKNEPLAVRLLSLGADPRVLSQLDNGIPVEIVVDDCQKGFGALYRFPFLAATHPIRVVIPVATGFSKVVRVAGALGFDVRLDVIQPDEALAGELERTLDYYLRNASLARPIEFFHSLFVAFVSGSRADMWQIHGEGPSTDRYVTDKGNEVFSRRVPGLPVSSGVAAFEEFKDRLLNSGGECAACPFAGPCSGYFKVPDGSYSCRHIRKLLQILADAAEEFRRGYEEFCRQHPESTRESGRC